jgi:hypothetical protein
MYHRKGDVLLIHSVIVHILQHRIHTVRSKRSGATIRHAPVLIKAAELKNVTSLSNLYATILVKA